jgi:YegS/Rv2252/BmrU family lipid kinase
MEWKVVKRVLVLYNESSGKDEGEKIAQHFLDYAKDKKPELMIKLQPTGPSISKDYVKKAKEENVDTLIIIGGDGTIHHTVKDFEENITKYSIGLIPGGTVNNLAKVLEIPLEEEKAFDTILEGKKRLIDYGKVNDEVIISTLTVGILADTAVKISQQEKQKFGPMIFIHRFIELLSKQKKYHLSIKTEDGIWEGKTQLLAVTMSNSVGGFTNFDDSAKPDDGKFHVTIVPKLNFLRYVFYLHKIVRGKFYEIPGINYLTSSELEIESKESKVGTRTDGDDTGNLPIKMTMVPKGLTIFVP